MSPENVVLWKEIDRILWEEWDPIGVNDYGGPDDEYRGYLPDIFQMKISGSSPEEIAKKLFLYATINMGLAGDLNHCQIIAEKITSLES